MLGVELRCEPAGTPDQLGGRQSPPASLRFDVGGREALVCYGRPSARGRKVFGELVPFEELWRTGANEPTVLCLPFTAEIAGLRAPRGRYALYTVPSRGHWTLVVNRSVRQWGLTRTERGAGGRVFSSAYTDAVRSAELGRVGVETAEVPYVEQLSIRAEPLASDTTLLLLEWETTQVRIPIRRAESLSRSATAAASAP